MSAKMQPRIGPMNACSALAFVDPPYNHVDYHYFIQCGILFSAVWCEFTTVFVNSVQYGVWCEFSVACYEFTMVWFEFSAARCEFCVAWCEFTTVLCEFTGYRRRSSSRLPTLSESL